jgi:hypothetical protein
MKTIAIGLLALLIGGSAAQAFTSGPPKARPAGFADYVASRNFAAATRNMSTSGRQKAASAHGNWRSAHTED